MSITISKDNVSDFMDSCGWNVYRKRSLVCATRMHGPFTVETREGRLSCPDGYLALDSEGWPYPIAKDEFERIYERVLVHD